MPHGRFLAAVAGREEDVVSGLSGTFAAILHLVGPVGRYALALVFFGAMCALASLEFATGDVEVMGTLGLVGVTPLVGIAVGATPRARRLICLALLATAVLSTAACAQWDSGRIHRTSIASTSGALLGALLIVAAQKGKEERKTAARQAEFRARGGSCDHRWRKWLALGTALAMPLGLGCCGFALSDSVPQGPTVWILLVTGTFFTFLPPLVMMTILTCPRCGNVLKAGRAE